MIKRTVAIGLPGGLSPGAAARLVARAQEYEGCQLQCEVGGGRVSVKSLMAVLSLALGRGDAIALIADGEREAEAMAALERILTEEENP